MNAADLLTKRARLTPEREALFDVHTGQRYTYTALNARANRAANFLRERVGVQAGDRVSILAHNCIAYVDLLYAVGKMGAILAPLNTRLVARELEYIVSDCEPKVLFVGPEFVPVAQELQRRANIPHLVALENAPIAKAFAYDAELPRASDAEPTRPVLNDDSVYCILYTSGTTGKPKGAMIPHRQVLWNCINTVISWGLREDDVAPIFTPMFHAGGLFVFLTPLLYAGGRVVLTRTFDAEKSLHLITDESCTVILGVPTLFQIWQDTEFFRDADFSPVRFFINGGAPCPTSIIEHWITNRGVAFRQGYGLTEVGTNCFTMTNEESARKIGSVGKPIFHSEMRLVNPETGGEVAPGEAGELLIRGPHVCLGYWRNEQATADALRDGWFHTGDSARQDGDGFYYIVGRYKDMLKSGGENIYAAEVEAVFREHPGVADAALIGQPDAKWGEVGVMIVVARADTKISEQELLAFCNERLARFKIPKRIIFVDALPYSPYGKVEKLKLKQKYLA
jgi:fatty-acyl-CoA synthase